MKSRNFFSSFTQAKLFQCLLIFVSLFPLFVYFLSQNYNGFGFNAIIYTVTLIGTISGAHVFASIYLLFSSKDYIGVKNPKLNLFYVPILIISINILIISFASIFLLSIFMLFYIHYAMWHFGRQNIGVFAFSSYISTRKPMTKLERNLIQLGIFAGVFGSYSVFAPTLMLNRDLFPFDLTHFDYTFSLIYKLGSFLYIVLIPVVFWYLLINSHKFNYRHCLLLLISIFFFLPLYLSDNPSYSLASYTTAHGLQYLLFLLFHSLANTNSKLVFLNSSTNSYSSKVFLFPFVVMPIVLLITCVFLAIELWGFLASVQVNGITDVVTIITKELSMKIAYGLILGITMAHYWVDQKLWKFSTKERRDWLSLNYPFLFNR